MQTLYDVLGLNRLATPEQINTAYSQNLESLLSGQNIATVEQNSIRAKAIKEAYSILSSPPRRATYDSSLRVKEQGTYQIAEKQPTPWGKITIALFLIVACALYYNHQQNKAIKERIALELQQAQAKAALAEQEALAEYARLEQIRVSSQRQADFRRESEMNRARYEGNQISYRNRQMDEQADRVRKRDAQRAASEAANQEREIKARSANEAAAMRRALQIPIGQPNYRSQPGGTIQNR